MLESLADGLWLARFPFSTAGIELGRNVSILRLSSGKTIVHSTAPFTPEDVAEIQSVGDPGWLLDATNFHDSYAEEGNASFPGLPYLVPDGFPAPDGVATESLASTPEEWRDDVDVVRIKGIPKINEHAFYHRPSKALVVCDLVFNMSEKKDRWTRWMLRFVSGIDNRPGNSRLFRSTIKDRDAFSESLCEILELDFEILVPGHGQPIVGNAREVVGEIFSDLGYEV